MNIILYSPRNCNRSLHRQRENRTAGAARWTDYEVVQVVQGAEGVLGDLIAIVNIEPLAAMLNGHEGILGTFNAPVHDEILRNVYGLAILHRS